MRPLRSLLILLLALTPAAVCSQGGASRLDEERILSFVNNVAIQRDGDLDVTQTIKVNVLNRQINHGVYWDFLGSYVDQAGTSRQIGMKVISVERDGHPEPWTRESLADGMRIRVGSKDVMVPPGEHTYVLHYDASGLVFQGKDYDELYWNATGNGWLFPIDMAEARIALPAPAAFTARDLWTGAQGSTDKNAAVITDRPGYIVFRTSKPLGAHEGMSVMVRFPKSVLDRPDGGQNISFSRDRISADASNRI